MFRLVRHDTRAMMRPNLEGEASWLDGGANIQQSEKEARSRECPSHISRKVSLAPSGVLHQVSPAGSFARTPISGIALTPSLDEPPTFELAHKLKASSLENLQ